MPNGKPDSNQVLDESMQRALQKVLKEMPDVNPVTVSPSNSSLLSRIMMPRNTFATTNPFTGNISYNPEAMQGQSQQMIENTLAHELTHSRQAQQTPWYKTALGLFTPDEKPPVGNYSNPEPYYWRPNEMEAFQAERNRARLQKQPDIPDPVYGSRDIQLPSPRRKPPKMGGVDY